MDAAGIQKKVWYGYGKAASKVGYPFDVYRPSDTLNPLVAKNWQGVQRASFTIHGASQFSFGKPSDWKSPQFHCLSDMTFVNIFDYFVNARYGVYFIASIDAIVPPLAVECCHNLTFYRRHTPTSATGAALTKGYSPDYGANLSPRVGGALSDTPMLTNIPASVLKAARGKTSFDLPADVGEGMYEILLPFIGGVLLRPSDVVTDEDGINYSIQAAERTGYGWRLTALANII